MQFTMDPDRKPSSEKHFRMLSLKVEVQNEVEVIKPILEEIELLRLCNSLGMLPSVRSEDFDHKRIEASEFDVEFTQCLRDSIFDSKQSMEKKLGIVGVFGTQENVKSELSQRGVWSTECDTNIKEYDEGVYCVLQLNDSGVQQIMLFAWLQDKRFAIDVLRDTATYVLRFLTGLSPNIVFCLSESDVKALQEAVEAQSLSESSRWGAYSIAFHVDRQEQEKDRVLLRNLTKHPLKKVPEYKGVMLVKGNNPGIGFIRTASRTTKWNSWNNESFNNNNEFTSWVLQKSKDFQIAFDRKLIRNVEIRDALLHVFDCWPHLKLVELEDKAINFDELKVQCEADIVMVQFSMQVEDLRTDLQAIINDLFDVNILLADGMNPALQNLETHLGSIHNNKELRSTMDDDEMVLLRFPLRLHEAKEGLFELFSSKKEKELDECLKLLVHKRIKDLSSLLKGKGFFKTLKGMLWDSVDKDSVQKFHQLVENYLNPIKLEWWNVVEKVLSNFYNLALEKKLEQKMSDADADREKNRNEMLQQAIQKFESDLRVRGENLPQMKINVDSRSRHSNSKAVNICYDYEVWTDDFFVVSILRIPVARDGLYRYVNNDGFALDKDENLVAMFSLKNQTILVIYESNGVYKLDKVKLSSNNLLLRQGNRTTLQTFGKMKQLLTDFVEKDRTLGVIFDNKNIILYRFNKAFTTMEVVNQLNLTLRTSLEAPLNNFVILEDSLYVTDCKKFMQAINLRSQQTSRKIRIGNEENNDGSICGLFSLSEGLVLGSVMLQDKSLLSGVRKQNISFHAISLEDHRVIPVEWNVEIEDFSHKIFAGITNSILYIVDVDANTIQTIDLKVTVRSDKFRIMKSSDKASSKELGRTQEKKPDHWIRVLYHVYEKFPVRGVMNAQGDNSVGSQRNLRFVVPAHTLKMCESIDSVCHRYADSVMTDLRSLNKPLYGMDLASGLNVEYSTLETSFIPNEWYALTQMESIILEMITFVPIQICRAELNTLTIMSDGCNMTDSLLPHSHLQNLQSTDIARDIRFGLLSPLFEAWQGRCIVVTSMGKQSTGKSYFLNHLTGSSFAIAGNRCTDGAWISARVHSSNTLIILLDFEGLGSFERTEQEDVFLSVLNASISMFTVFRMEMRLDKEIDSLFSKFQKGVQLLKKTPQLFRGKLYMSVKDVNPNDQQGVVDEFATKFEQLIGSNKEKNFLTEMYGGKLDVNCSPPLGTTGYYDALMYAKHYIETDLCGSHYEGFSSGKEFLDCIRLVLAKISILDWTSLDDNSKKLKWMEVAEKIPGILRTGCIIPIISVDNTKTIAERMKQELHAKSSLIKVTLAQVIHEYPLREKSWIALNDKINLDLLPDRKFDVGFDLMKIGSVSFNMAKESLNRLYQIYLKLRRVSNHDRLNEMVQADFDDFLAFVMHRRYMKIKIWMQNMVDGDIPEEWNVIEQQLVSSFSIFTRCMHKCSSCQMGCMYTTGHPSTTTHDCNTNHKCRGKCDYCGELDHTALCSKVGGHGGKCECRDGDHTCKFECVMQVAPNCGKRCSAKIGHTGEHRCSVQVHLCGETCSANNCSRSCILNMENLHTAHKCPEERCMEECFMDGCKEKCYEKDHFHGQSTLAVTYSVESGSLKEQEVFGDGSVKPVHHMCDKAHDCQIFCEEEGICHFEVSQSKKIETFSGIRGSFQYTYQNMNGSRKKCVARLEPGQKTHSSHHSCIKDAHRSVEKVGSMPHTKHYCDARCPCCSYFCNKSYGHMGLHTTSHGNMRNTFFLSENKNVDIGDRKYVAGDTGIAEMCNLYCSKMGRAHVHYLRCEQGDSNKCVHTDPEENGRRHCNTKLVPKPNEPMDELLCRQFWKTLGWEDPCSLVAEKELFGKCAYQCDAPDHNDKPSYCVLPAWHAPVSKSTSRRDTFTYIQGHKFECCHTNSNGKMHHIFVLDCSGSMQGWPWEKLMGGYREYINNRRTDGGSSADLVSVITFDHEGQIDFEGQGIATVLHNNIHYRGGGTRYAGGLRLASETLSRNNHDKYRPILVFFSDGQPCDALEGNSMASHIQDVYSKYGLKSFVVGYGEISLDKLQLVAANLGGSYHHALDGTELKETFQKISVSLNTRTGLAITTPIHDKLCSICKLDLAVGKAKNFQSCEHALHEKCWNDLVKNVIEGENVTCPVCRTDLK